MNEQKIIDLIAASKLLVDLVDGAHATEYNNTIGNRLRDSTAWCLFYSTVKAVERAESPAPSCESCASGDSSVGCMPIYDGLCKEYQPRKVKLPSTENIPPMVGEAEHIEWMDSRIRNHEKRLTALELDGECERR